MDASLKKMPLNIENRPAAVLMTFICLEGN